MAAGLSWPLREELTAEQLGVLLFPHETPQTGRAIPQLNWRQVHKELKRKGVSLSVLWVEYRQVHLDGYGYSPFFHRYKAWSGNLKPVMRQRHA